ncbi:hypothetical protein [Vibrio tritonius]|uniref:hypothetical protein n=1 Tax=Vibrio tritonius TaxID=1435069 RepID=UPI0008398029|nr:hypothetical protein [Vibrio tritonius]
MGIGSNYYVKVAEDEYKEELLKEIARDAAVHVVNGIDRSAAIKKAKATIEAQQEAIAMQEYYEDEDGIIRFFDSSIESPQTPTGKHHQVATVAKELKDTIG